MYELKIYRGVICHDNERWCKKLREMGLWVQNWHEEFNKFLPEHSKASQICTLMGYFGPKYIVFELRKYKQVMFDGTQDWYKVLKKTDVCFQKWNGEFGKVFPVHLEVSKLGIWWHPFV